MWKLAGMDNKELSQPQREKSICFKDIRWALETINGLAQVVCDVVK
jgi:hypothetical protein